MKGRIPFANGDECDVHGARHIVCLSRKTIRAAKRSYNRRLRKLFRSVARDTIRREADE